MEYLGKGVATYRSRLTSIYERMSCSRLHSKDQQKRHGG